MKRIKNPSVGQLVQVPVIEFAPQRRGWNGWLFRVGVIEKLYISKSGRKCAKVRYCTKRAGRYQLLPCTEYSKGFVIEDVFQWDNLALVQSTYVKGGRGQRRACLLGRRYRVPASERIHPLSRNGLKGRLPGMTA